MLMMTLLSQHAQVSLRDALRAEGLPPLLIDELVDAVMRVNYGQTADIPAFVGAVSLAGNSEDLWALIGGNKQVTVSMID
jgi:prenylcysteine oxidase/farnesylcysteine lyase